MLAPANHHPHPNGPNTCRAASRLRYHCTLTILPTLLAQKTGNRFLFRLAAGSADASQGEDAEHTENSIPGQFMKGAMRIHGGVAGKVSRREDGVEKFAGNRKNARGKVTAQKTRARTSSLLGDVRNTNASPGLGGQRPEEGGRTYSRPGDASGASYEADAFHEQLIWDELRDSLAGRDRGPPQKRHVRDTVEEAKRDIDSEERRRRLIEEAIAILLESSSDEEGVDGEGEDSGRR